MAQRKLPKALASVLLAMAIVFGTSVVVPQAAQASVVSCSSGRCTLYLSKSETRSLGSGRVPAPPASAPVQIKASYYALAYGHRWFAQQYANRGWCSGFRLSIYPWESQGYFGYACNWN